MSAIGFQARITKVELSTSAPVSACIELQRCSSMGVVEAPFGALFLAKVQA